MFFISGRSLSCDCTDAARTVNMEYGAVPVLYCTVFRTVQYRTWYGTGTVPGTTVSTYLQCTVRIVLVSYPYCTVPIRNDTGTTVRYRYQVPGTGTVLQ